MLGSKRAIELLVESASGEGKDGDEHQGESQVEPTLDDGTGVAVLYSTYQAHDDPPWVFNPFIIYKKNGKGIGRSLVSRYFGGDLGLLIWVALLELAGEPRPFGPSGLLGALQLSLVPGATVVFPASFPVGGVASHAREYAEEVQAYDGVGHLQERDRLDFAIKPFDLGGAGVDVGEDGCAGANLRLREGFGFSPRAEVGKAPPLLARSESRMVDEAVVPVSAGDEQLAVVVYGQATAYAVHASDATDRDYFAAVDHHPAVGSVTQRLGLERALALFQLSYLLVRLSNLGVEGGELVVNLVILL